MYSRPHLISQQQQGVAQCVLQAAVEVLLHSQEAMPPARRFLPCSCGRRGGAARLVESRPFPAGSLLCREFLWPAGGSVASRWRLKDRQRRDECWGVTTSRWMSGAAKGQGHTAATVLAMCRHSCRGPCRSVSRLASSFWISPLLTCTEQPGCDAPCARACLQSAQCNGKAT